MIQIRDNSFATISYNGGSDYPYRWVDLGYDGVIAIVIDQDHSLVDVIMPDTPLETAVTLAHNMFIIVHEDYLELPVIRALIDEHELYRDCFGIV